MNTLDEVKTAHMHKTPQMEQISLLQAENQKLRTENINLKEKLLMAESENNAMRARWVEQQERIIDYQEFLAALNKLEALEAWFNDNEE